jgi:thiol-disulfide isomerase/thioredoxin
MPFLAKIILFLLLIIANNQTPTFAQIAQEYEKNYREAYQNALNFLKNNQTLFKAQLIDNQGLINTIIPAVFPEMVRYSEVQNMLETASLELLYVNYGNAYADFSIGRFQMKPSFVEKIETYITDYQLINYYNLLKYSDKNEKKMRQERLRRLKDLTWQLQYLQAFYTIVHHKFQKNFATLSDKIRFFATAYNRGFDQPVAEIDKWLTIRAFPYGLKYRGTQYIYSEIALDFYFRYFVKIFP